MKEGYKNHDWTVDEVMTLDDYNDNDDDIIMHTMIVINMIAMR